MENFGPKKRGIFVATSTTRTQDCRNNEFPNNKNLAIGVNALPPLSESASLCKFQILNLRAEEFWEHNQCYNNLMERLNFKKYVRDSA
jgi:hypothetical protein